MILIEGFLASHDHRWVLNCLELRVNRLLSLVRIGDETRQLGILLRCSLFLFLEECYA
jgi:hypothetical protein